MLALSPPLKNKTKADKTKNNLQNKKPPATKKTQQYKKPRNSDARANSLFYKTSIIAHTETVFLFDTCKLGEMAFSPINSSANSSVVVLVQESKDSPLDVKQRSGSSL